MVRVSVTDKDGGESNWTEIGGVTVTGEAPTFTIDGRTDGVPGQPRTYTLSAPDADPGTEFAFNIDWDGDGLTDQVVVGVSGTEVMHVFAGSGAFNVRTTATDQYAPAGLLVTIQLAQVQDGDLVVGGTPSDDRFVFSPGPTAGQVSVIRNGANLGTFMVAGSVRVFGRGGHDMVTVNGTAGRDTIETFPAYLTVN